MSSSAAISALLPLVLLSCSRSAPGPGASDAAPRGSAAAAEAAPTAPEPVTAPDGADVAPPAVEPVPPVAEPTPPVVPEEPPDPPVVRVRGPVEGAVEPLTQRLAAGAPLIVRFRVTNAGDQPIKFRFGGDNYAQGPLRFTWLVRGANGEVECDLRTRPEPMSGGGGSANLVLATGETHERWLVPQTGCAALSKPGRHRLRLVRILTDDDLAPEGCSEILVPDTTVDPPDDHGRAEQPECLEWLLGAPAVAAEFELDVLPYDAAAVREGLERALAAVERDEQRNVLAGWARWLAFRLGQNPAGPMTTDEELQGLAASLPASLPDAP
jgi:hypothetical protein